VVGHQPGKGSYQGTLTVTGSGDDQYKVSMDINYASGDKASGEGNAIVYTGYEWRAQLQLGDQSTLQVFMASESGDELSGRWFLEDSDSLGGDLTAVRMDTGTARILAVAPEYVRAGETKEVAVHGVNLDGDVGLGDGVEVVSTVTRDPQTVVVQVKANADASVGTRTVKVGAATASELFTVYHQVDSVRVEPAYAIARVGGADGPLPPVPAQFDAVAYANGPDGEPDTDDDIRIGVMPATWSVDNFSETAVGMDDVKYAGNMQAGGLFVPAGAGLNLERPFSTNNVGDLAVKASVADGTSTVEGSGHLIVTVQRWNDPPIR
ncbi:MAG: quinohemoprotein amine dehydrogenase subunit alpha, partial [Gammaproteobacteria bacterium]|nr:quinohemoprotein amine dehydrogenase subunit alpha [Gammaproteobacteria bacterium]